MKNLNAEMARFGIRNEDICALLGCSDRTVVNKLNETSEFSITECFKIRDRFFPSLRLEYLFSPDNRINSHTQSNA